MPDEFAKRWVGGIKEEAEEVGHRAPGTAMIWFKQVVHNMVHNRC
jgi:hypothetical protein